MKTPEQQVEDLKRQGGIDVAEAEVGTKILIETTMAVYELKVLEPSTARVDIQGTDQIFSASKGVHQAEVVFSTTGAPLDVSVPNWIGKGLRIALKSSGGVIVMVSSVVSARITAPDESWSYEL